VELHKGLDKSLTPLPNFLNVFLRVEWFPLSAVTYSGGLILGTKMRNCILRGIKVINCVTIGKIDYFLSVLLAAGFCCHGFYDKTIDTKV